MVAVSDASESVDPEELQRQLSDIKGAMGLAEQYPGRARLWLVAGLIIGVAALLVQATFFLYETLGAAAYVAVWGVFSVVAVATLWLVSARLPSSEAPEGAPSWRVLYGSLGAFVVAATGVTGDAAGQIPGLDRALLYFGLVIATIGLGLLVTGAVLAAYRVRRRDRLVFYAGGAWVLLFASALPHVEMLRYVGVGVFGILFIVYAIAAYVYLTRA
ncbi:hypothetical protein HZS54_22515 [Halosimplex pelagicum]|uniref:DUF2157 domain-containing protein n=1 Tax=Halosimplex pelagicum TaxID=869886 RepID=A0A7D5PGQ8_9EURY|nr:hypothetical protein HZS54_22515 [Halosimplex pelagicum]